MEEWKEWFTNCGIDWTFWDSVGSSFDDPIIDVFTLPDRDAVGMTVEGVGYLPDGLQIGVEPEPWKWSAADLAWLDIGFVSDPKHPNRSWPSAPPADSELDSWHILRVENPLTLPDLSNKWPFRQGVQGFMAHKEKRWRHFGQSQERREWLERHLKRSR